MSQMARHLKAEHAQGVPSRLMQPVGGRPPSQPRVPIHLMVPHSTNTPGSGASSSSSSRQPTPGAGESVLQSRVRAAPTHVVPRYDVYGFALQQPPPGVAARQLRTVDRGPEVPRMVTLTLTLALALALILALTLALALALTLT